MKSRRHLHLLGSFVLIAGCSLVLSSCLGFGGGSSASTPSTLQMAQVTTTLGATGTSVADAGDQPAVVSPADQYSSFQAKDPFVQQAVATPTTVTSSTSTTTPPPTTTTTTSPPASSTTTTSSTSTTSTSSSTTSTTSFFTHMLQILAVGDVNGTAAVTFQVDNNVYENQHVGDKVSTSWGDVTVVAIDSSAQKVTLLHDGQTLTMAVHQTLFE